MKKWIVMAGIVSAAFFSSAQINGGTIITGGFASFNQRMYTNPSSSSGSLSIQPQFGLAFADNFIAGAWFSINSFSSVKSWSVSPFLRYYWKNVFVQGGYGYSYSKVADITSEGSIIDFELGYAAFLNNNVALEPALYYNGVFSGKTYSYTDLGIKLGFQIYLNRD